MSEAEDGMISKDDGVGLNSRLERIEDVLLRGVRPDGRKFKLPFKIRLRQKRLAKKGRCIVITPLKNKNIDASIAEVRDGGIWYKENLYDAPTEGFYLWRGKYPCVVLPEWSNTPMTFSDVKDTQITQKILVRRLQMEIAKMGDALKDKKKKLTLGLAVGGIVILGLIIYIFSGGIGG